PITPCSAESRRSCEARAPARAHGASLQGGPGRARALVLAAITAHPILPHMSRSTVIAALLSPLLAGCVQRTMTIKSDPPGALVSHKDQEGGRTPLKRDFTWYGDSDVQIRKEGYEPRKTPQPVIARWYEWVPFDLFAQMLPMRATDNH